MGLEASTRLAQLRADSRYKLPDCCVLLAAQEHNGAIVSFDSALIDAAHSLGLSTHE
jgi:predicted DNA-binding protein (UPF0278 family)